MKAYTKGSLDLPLVPDANPKRISDFSEKLMCCVQALQTLKKLEQVNGMVSLTLEKLPAIHGDSPKPIKIGRNGICTTL